MVRQGFDLEMEGRHVVEEAGVDKVVWVGAGSAQCLAAPSRKPATALTVCRKVGTLRS